MIEKINTPVSVISSFNHYLHSVQPQKIIWNGRQFVVTKNGFHHTFRQGRTLFHVFSVVANGMFFKLTLDTDSLFWCLDEVSDGLPA